MEIPISIDELPDQPNSNELEFAKLGISAVVGEWAVSFEWRGIPAQISSRVWCEVYPGHIPNFFARFTKSGNAEVRLNDRVIVLQKDFGERGRLSIPSD